jgi:signal peptidase I
MTAPVKNPTETSKQRRYGIFISVLIGLILAIMIRLVIEPTVVVGDSMFPTLKEGQYLISYRLAYKTGKPEFGDIVIVEPKNPVTDKRIIKRVIGLPGDTVKISDDQLYLNGKKVKEPYIREAMKGNQDMTVKLGKDQIFVMGDNRNNSLDSRMIGPINYKKEVRGKVILRLFPLDQSFKKAELLPAK